MAVFGLYDDKGTFNPIAVPPSIIEILIDKPEHTAPVVTGLITHPLVLSSGLILESNGLDATTGLFLSGVGVECRAYDQAEACVALKRLRENLLAGFEFETELDADAAIAGLLTGLQRRVLDSSPGLAVLASAQSSGKTTLARRIHVILTGRDMPVSNFPQNDEAEVQKRLLAMLLRSPAMVCFDNVMDGTTFRSGAIAGAMTGPMLEQRMLGESREASVLTNTLFVLTGNNLQLGADEVSRWLISRLSPSTARPEERTFANPDVVGHAVSIRDSVLQDAIGIIAGWLQCGQSKETKSRFPRWDLMVRQPLIWAGGKDVAEVFARNTDGAEHILALESLAIGLDDIFGETDFLAADLIRVIQNDTVFASDLELRLSAMDEIPKEKLRTRLVTALESLRTRDTGNSRSVGRCLASQIGRVAKIGERHVRLKNKTVKGEVFYYMETVKG